MKQHFHLVLVVSASRPSWYSLMDLATGDEIVLPPLEEKRMKSFMLRLIERSVEKTPALVKSKEYARGTRNG